jgi:hypothetical protein
MLRGSRRSTKTEQKAAKSLQLVQRVPEKVPE